METNVSIQSKLKLFKLLILLAVLIFLGILLVLFVVFAVLTALTALAYFLWRRTRHMSLVATAADKLREWKDYIVAKIRAKRGEG